MTEYSKLLSYWHKLEHFSPASTPRSTEKDVILLNSSNVPWKIPIRSTKLNQTIEYSVFLGVFDSQKANEFVNNFFEVPETNENYRSSKICYASIKLNEEGKYINESFGLSTLPWALHQLQNYKLKSDSWNKDFKEIRDKMMEYIELSLKDVVDYTGLIDLQKKIVSLSGWSTNKEYEIYVKSSEIHIKKEDSKITSDVLNSFYITDLERIISAINSNGISKAFNQYLEGCVNKVSNKIDLSKNTEQLKDVLSPLNYPDGCWPSEYTLSLMQQYAVNVIFNQLKDDNKAGMFSVNGPPGTGKTTLLRDIIAPIIVNRAKELFKISNPADAFKRVGELKVNENFKAHIYQPIDSISNGGIVITSSNNGAVENISRELPLKTEVSEMYRNEISYFKEAVETCIGENYWGAISAVLGNKQNKRNLFKSLWFDGNIKGLQKTLNEKKIVDNSEWKEIKLKFENKLKEISTEKQRLETNRKEYEESLLLENELKSISKKLPILEKDYNKVKAELFLLNDTLKTLNKKESGILHELEIIKQTKPNFFTYLFNSTKRKIYRTSIDNALRVYNEIAEEIKVEREKKLPLQINYDDLKNTYNTTKLKEESLSKQLNVLVYNISEAKAQLNKNYADTEFWSAINTLKSQQSCPWYSVKLKKLNSELFIISLKMHEVFILTANERSSQISTTLAAFFDYLNGDKNPTVQEAKAMWNTFFLVIPVVSSTFASIQTMFKDLDRENIPWLFIDEAGQAVPQAAVGSIWRSKRVAVVGDPLQIEPVVTISNAITDNLNKYFELDSQQVNSKHSVQTMADRVNSLGTYLNVNGKDEWIGIPLRVHRRCISPMFDIANSISYDNTMFNLTAVPNTVSVKFKTAFIHCEGNVDGKHYVHEQAEIVRKIILDEINHLQNFPNVFIISPFSEVSFKLRRFLSPSIMSEINKYQKVNNDGVSTWLNSHIGTVHTFQGKQADGVILCLGLDRNSERAANWASQKPNLLNVALTRAKYRFIAVGDKDIWEKKPYFSKLKEL